jgi:hypothetical protein
MIRQSRDGVVFYQFAALSQYPEIVHAVFTRIGGRSVRPFDTLNVGHAVGDVKRHVERNHGVVLQTIGLSPRQVVTARQVHGAHVAVVDGTQAGTIVPNTDALASNVSGVVLLLRFADCLPIMLYDPRHRAVAMVHAGWRGCLSGVVANTMDELRQSYGTDPTELIACLGPAIGPCCYQVGPDVIAEIEQALPEHDGLVLALANGSVHFDLPGAVRRQLRQAGVQEIEDGKLCTCCHTGEFFSHRAEGSRTGRFAAVLGLNTPQG